MTTHSSKIPQKQTTYSLVQSLTHQTSGTSSIDFHSQMLAISTREGVISVLDAEEGEIVRTHHCSKYGVNCMRYFHTSEVAAVASAIEGADAGSWRLWDFQANKFSAVFRGHERTVKNLEVHPVDDAVISTCSEISVFWDVRSDKYISKFNFRCAPVFEKTQGRFFIGAPSEDAKAVGLFDIRNFDKPFTSFPVDDPVNELALSPDGAVLALAHDDRVVTFDVQRGSALCRSGKLRSPKNISFNWSADLLAASVDKEIHILKISGLHKFQTITDHQGPALGVFSPNRDLLVSAATGVGLWCPI